ncbi:hypothetical protein Anapl_10410 [Anas platyrhynchos]|uniref:Uncharacterized protein n=1 Tax=Anas platyrhynchos TaxID=8839 RepID=R0LY37_ANAPL|nr:hypothetical protein Anapl_10410 [Anas platyrhynchos]
MHCDYICTGQESCRLDAVFEVTEMIQSRFIAGSRKAGEKERGAAVPVVPRSAFQVELKGGMTPAASAGNCRPPELLGVGAAALVDGSDLHSFTERVFAAEISFINPSCQCECLYAGTGIYRCKRSAVDVHVEVHGRLRLAFSNDSQLREPGASSTECFSVLLQDPQSSIFPAYT